MSISHLKTLQLEEIRTLAATGATADDVANQIKKKSKLGANLIKYIAQV